MESYFFIDLFLREKRAKIPDIKQNVHESIYDIVHNMDKISPPVELEKNENRKAAEFILKLGPEVPEEFTNVRPSLIQMHNLHLTQFLIICRNIMIT